MRNTLSEIMVIMVIFLSEIMLAKTTFSKSHLISEIKIMDGENIISKITANEGIFSQRY